MFAKRTASARATILRATGDGPGPVGSGSRFSTICRECGEERQKSQRKGLARPTALPGKGYPGKERRMLPRFQANVQDAARLEFLEDLHHQTFLFDASS